MSYSQRLMDELSGDLRRIAEIAGVEAAVRIALEFKGTYLYIRGVDGLLRIVRDMNIKEEYEKGVDMRKLSRKYRLTQRQIRNILDADLGEAIPEGIKSILGDRDA